MVRRIIIAIGLLALVGLVGAAAYVSLHPIRVVLMFHSVVQQPQGLDVSPAGLRSILDSAHAAPHRVIATTDSSDHTVYEAFAPGVQDRRLAAILFLMPPFIDRNGMLTWGSGARVGSTRPGHRLPYVNPPLVAGSD